MCQYSCHFHTQKIPNMWRSPIKLIEIYTQRKNSLTEHTLVRPCTSNSAKLGNTGGRIHNLLRIPSFPSKLQTVLFVKEKIGQKGRGSCEQPVP